MTLNCIGCDKELPIFIGEPIDTPDDWGFKYVEDDFAPEGYAKFCACPDCKDAIQ